MSWRNCRRRTRVIHLRHELQVSGVGVPIRGSRFTAVVRGGPVEYVAIALAFNVAARGRRLSEVKENLVEAVEAVNEGIEEDGVSVEPISAEELIEFLRETSAVPCSVRARDREGVPLQVFCYA